MTLMTLHSAKGLEFDAQDQEESPFIAEVPEDGLVVHESPELFHGRRTAGVYDFFGRGGGRGGRGRSGHAAERSFQAPSFEPSGGGGLKRGGRVRHATLGDGVVLEVEGSGDDTKLTVFFHRAGKRKILAKYADLEAL